MDFNTPMSNTKEYTHILVAEIQKTPRLCEDDTLHSLRNAQNGCIPSRDALVAANMRLVLSLSHEYMDCGVPLADLLQEGTLGLMRAIEKFDATKAVKFSTYASWWIKQRMRRIVTANIRMIRIPDHLYYRSIKLKRHFDVGNTNIQSLATQTKLRADQLSHLQHVVMGTLSLDQPCDPHSDKLIDVADTTCHEDVILEKLWYKNSLYRHLAKLPERSQLIISLRYGLRDDTFYSYKDISKLLDISRERVRQIEEKSLGELRSYFKFDD